MIKRIAREQGFGGGTQEPKFRMHAAEWFKFQPQFGNRSRFWASISCAAWQVAFVLSSCCLTWTAATCQPEGALSFWAWRFYYTGQMRPAHQVRQNINTEARLRQPWGLLSFSVCGDKCYSLRRLVFALRGGLQCSHYCMISFDSCEERTDGNIFQTTSFMFGQLRTSSPCLSFNFASGFNWPPFLSGTFSYPTVQVPNMLVFWSSEIWSAMCVNSTMPFGEISWPKHVPRWRFVMWRTCQ